MKALVTGGAGFIGSHIVDELIAYGLEVFCLDNLSNGKMENVSQKAKFLQKDILETEYLKKLFKKEKFDYVFHNAALVSIRHSLDNFFCDCQTNVLGTLSLLEACKICPPKRFIYASSMGVYGDSEKREPIKETDPVLPISPYGISKSVCEQYIKLICPFLKMEYILLRYFNTYGPRQVYSSYVGVITIFAKLLQENKRPVIFGNGTQCRDFISVKDVARANIRAMETKNSNEIYNVGTGKPTSVNEIYQLISQALHKSLPPRYHKKDRTELNFAVANAEKAKKKLNFSSQRELSREAILEILKK